jgi:hypothetical protein
MTNTEKKKAVPPPNEPPPPVISISKIEAGRILVPIRGTAPLIMNNWSAKAKRQMLLNMQGVKLPKENKDPEAEYQSAFYLLDETGPEGEKRYGFPLMAFKEATVGAARFYTRSVTMVALRQFLFFKGCYSTSAKQQLVEIVGTPERREDPVTVGRGGRDLRYRPEFWPWRATLDISFAKTNIDQESVLSLLDAGGLGVGVGEWRPEKKGVFGTFEVDPDEPIEVLNG